MSDIPAGSTDTSVSETAAAPVVETAAPVVETAAPVVETAAPDSVVETAPVAAPVVETAPVAAPVVETAAAAPVVANVQNTPAIPSPAPVGTIPFPDQDFEGYITWIKNSGSNSQKEVVRVMEDYLFAMAPRKIINEVDGVKMQFRLYKMLETVLNSSPSDEFKATWNTVLAYFKKYKESTLGALYVNRFAHAWSSSIVQLTALQRLINLLHLTCDANSRTVGLKQVDLDATTSEGFTPIARQRILEFYQG